MSTGDLYWEDVAFSRPAANAVTDAASSLDRVVEAAIVSLCGLSQDARVDWTGQHLVEFERSYPAVMRGLYELREAVFDLQARVAACAQRAAAEQSRREALRDQWRAEQEPKRAGAMVGVR